MRYNINGSTKWEETDGYVGTANNAGWNGNNKPRIIVWAYLRDITGMC